MVISENGAFGQLASGAVRLLRRGRRPSARRRASPSTSAGMSGRVPWWQRHRPPPADGRALGRRGRIASSASASAAAASTAARPNAGARTTAHSSRGTRPERRRRRSRLSTRSPTPRRARRGCRWRGASTRRRASTTTSRSRRRRARKSRCCASSTSTPTPAPSSAPTTGTRAGRRERGDLEVCVRVEAGWRRRGKS